jgi:AraC-like DNA-binding protein
VVLSPLREGSFRASQVGPLLLFHFRLAPELVGGLLTPVEKDRLEALAAHPTYAVQFFASDVPAAQRFAQLPETAGQPNALLQRAEMLRIVALLFAEELARPVPADTAFLSARQRVKLLINQVPEAEFLRMAPREMALRCGSSLTHFNRSFRTLFGMSPGEKQELIRLQKARQTLLETTSRLEALASEAGYRDVRQFSAAFKKQFGVTPQEWRHPKLRKARTRSNGAPNGPS